MIVRIILEPGSNHIQTIENQYPDSVYDDAEGEYYEEE